VLFSGDLGTASASLDSGDDMFWKLELVGEN